ncbi:hypothetical protein [Chitinophaga nivalis]|uniref:YcxB-like protein domain-containing protein n=1 Tax=Chitinophaga nivalis TaxID=2991709 RepID=A0ABT3IMW8_9BACT|nr:hypothetical protein [Chitinophaga nivalis]MCW3464991.1 hypothetical protein [Chitinophaga nivalis]MCW3485317.1 hypothetical protein [Chitinophaga nivalis]
MDKSVITHVLAPYPFTIYMFSYMMGGMLATALLALYFHLVYLIWIGFFLFMILPLVIQKHLWKLVSQKVVAHFNSEYFTLEITDSKTGKVVNENMYLFSEIKFYYIGTSSGNNSTCLKLFLSDGSRAKYSFVGLSKKCTSQEAPHAVDQYIQAYNKGKDKPHQIILLRWPYTRRI